MSFYDPARKFGMKTQIPGLGRKPKHKNFELAAANPATPDESDVIVGSVFRLKCMPGRLL
jgi:hypothetical protein